MILCCIIARMKIILIRHLKTDMEWREYYTAAEYDDAMQIYRQMHMPLVVGQHVVGGEYAFYCSTAPCTYDTIMRLFNVRDVTKTPLLDEVLLRSFTDDVKPRTLAEWQRKAKRQWRSGDARQPETKVQTEARAEELLKMLERANKDCVLVSHAFYLRTVIKRLKAHGYVVERPGFFSIGFGERMRATKRSEHCGGCRYNCVLTNPACEVGRDKAIMRRIKMISENAGRARF